DIVNSGIQGEGFAGPGSTQSFMTINLPFSETLFGESIVLFDGFMLEQQGMLLSLSFMFLLLVLVNGLFKRDINVRKGRMGERMLRRLRFELADRILRFPLLHMRRVKQSEMATMIKDEVEPLGGFIGDAFVTPAYLGGQAITAMFFILVQSVWLGLVAAAIVLVQAFIIPRLRRRILVLARERQLTARALAGRIGELVDGAVEIQAHDASNFERADLSTRLGKIYHIRYEFFKRKFSVKFLNNLLAQFTPFVFYAGGGLLAIRGHLDIGALVAVIAAYKDLPGPIKELIDWDQQRADVQIKYDQVIEQFQPASVIDPEKQKVDNEEGPPLEGDVTVTAVSLLDENDFKLLDGVTFSFDVRDHVAIVGPSGSGKEHIAFLLSGLVPATGGSVRIGGRDLESLPSAVTGRKITYVGQDSYHFATTVRENMLYGLKHQPLREVHYEGADRAARDDVIIEARRSGNPEFDFAADWVDYGAAGAKGPDDISDKIIEMLRLVELEEDVYRFGLTGTIDPEVQPEAATAILEARKMLVERLTKDGVEDLVVRFHAGEYNEHATLAENLLFGTPTKKEYRSENLAENELLHRVLSDQNLTGDFLKMGISIARTMVEIFQDLPPGHPFFEQFSFISDDDLPDFRALLSRHDTSGSSALGDDERARLLSLPFNYVEARHRMGLVDEQMAERLIAARGRFREELESTDPGAVEVYHADRYNAAADLQDNILFGRIAYGKAQANDIVGRAITDMLDSMGLRDTVIQIGLDYKVGVGGKRLSSVQRQKLGLARALLKAPDILVIDEAVAVMDGATQQRLLEKILAHREGRGVIWTLQRPSMAKNFLKIVVMQSGRAIEHGSYEQLKSGDSALSKLMAAE
ncbi:MAG: ABC transporter ATP-binding protein, partial [Kiloniellales bacterium]|nr:ABC transporter ATP-binding protein [Kiloniellales bacterium]